MKRKKKKKNKKQKTKKQKNTQTQRPRTLLISASNNIILETKLGIVQGERISEY